MNSNNELYKPFPPSDNAWKVQHRFQEALNLGKTSSEDPKVKEICIKFLNSMLSDEELSELNPHRMVIQAKKKGAEESLLEEVFTEVAKIGRSRSDSVGSNPSLLNEEKPVPLTLIVDVDTTDHNGAMLSLFTHEIRQDIPLICSRRIPLGFNFETHQSRGQIVSSSLNYIKKNHLIFASGDYLIFLPITFKKELSLDKRLEALDINLSSVKEVSLAQAFETQLSNPTLQGLKSIFKPASHPKLFFLIGHGQGNSPAGMNADNYQDFLSFLKKQKCRGLVISSCFSGGKSTLLHLLPPSDKNKFEKIRKPLQFPVIVRSITDAGTLAAPFEEADSGTFLPKLIALWSSAGGRTLPKLKQLIQAEENLKRSKPAQNSMQVLFPSSADIPQGFRPVQEGKNLFTFTLNSFKKIILEKKDLTLKGPGHITFLLSYIPYTLKIAGDLPQFISAIPGVSRHYIKNIHLTDYPFCNTFIAHLFDGGLNIRQIVQKSYFMETLSSNKESYRSIFVDSENKIAGYIEDQTCCLINEILEKTIISKEEFSIHALQVYQASKPSEESIRSATAGQESSDAFEEPFFESFLPCDPQFRNFLKPSNLQRLSYESLNIEIARLNLSEKSQVALLNFLMEFHPKVVLEFLLKTHFPITKKDSKGLSLLQKAILSDNEEVALYLLKSGADPNYSTKNTPSFFEMAVFHPSENLFNQMIKTPTLNILQKKRGYPLYIKLLSNLPRFKKIYHLIPLSEKGSLFNVISNQFDIEKKSYSLLSFAARYAPLETIKFIASQEPEAILSNKGISPLRSALTRGVPEIINYLIEKGADPYLEDSEGRSSLEQAMEKSPLIITKELLKNHPLENLEKNAQSYFKETLFYAALRSGEADKILFALSLNPVLSKPMPKIPHIFEEMITLERFDIIEAVVKKITPHPEGLESAITGKLIKIQPEILLKLLPYYENMTHLLIKILERKKIPFALKKAFIQKASEEGYTFKETTKDRYGIPFTLLSMLEKENLSEISDLIKKVTV